MTHYRTKLYKSVGLGKKSNSRVGTSTTVGLIHQLTKSEENVERRSCSNKRALESSDSDDSSSSKRVCMTLDVDDTVSRLPSVELPVEIQKFPLVLQRVAAVWMTTEDAVLQAAATGQSPWLTQLLSECKCIFTEAAGVTTSDGDTLETVVQLLQQLEGPVDCQRYLGSNVTATLEKAALIAARNGHRDTVGVLLQALEVDGKVNQDAAWKVLEEAAANGHLSVVQFATRYVVRSKGDEERCVDSKAVSLAIAGGHVDVVVYLLRYPWNVACAFMEAVGKQQHVVAERIYQIFPFYFEGKNLFVEMASDGFLTAVKYMYEHGHKDEKLVQDAFLKAAAGTTRRTEVMEFLISTGHVSLEVFETAFEAAATSGSVSTVAFLYEKHFGSVEGIYRAFERSSSLSVTKCLFKKEKIPAKTIATAFKNVTGIGSTILAIPKKEREAVAAFLYHNRSSMPCSRSRIYRQNTNVGAGTPKATNIYYDSVLMFFCCSLGKSQTPNGLPESCLPGLGSPGRLGSQ